jgi:hypothetical protein
MRGPSLGQGCFVPFGAAQGVSLRGFSLRSNDYAGEDTRQGGLVGINFDDDDHVAGLARRLVTALGS